MKDEVDHFEEKRSFPDQVNYSGYGSDLSKKFRFRIHNTGFRI